MEKLIRFVCTVLIIAGCSSDKGFELNGKLSGGNGMMIYLDELGTSELITVDSSLVGENGSFHFRRELTVPKFYLLKLDPGNFITLLIGPGEDIFVTAAANNLADGYEVEGSPDSKLIQDYNNYLYQNIQKLNELNKIYNDSLESPNIAEIISDLNNRSVEILEDQKNFTIRYITDNNRSLVSLLALYQQISPRNYVLKPMEDIEYFEMVDSTLYALFPESEPVQALHAQVIELRQRIEADRIKEMQFAIGALPPEIALPGPAGDTLTLSSTRGNIVLLDFWAAWCNPCREENPNLVENYNKYHSKGFEIFQVSLDRNRDNWLGAIENDKIDQWIHVSDLQFWNSIVVELYKLEQIPTNFLLDREGKIIARDLRGENLDKKLSELFD